MNGTTATNNPNPNPIPNATALTGVAASGKPLVGATVTIKDSTGKQSTATTTSTGSFSVDTTGMTAPVLVKTTGGGTTFFSASPDTTGNVNVHQVSNSIVQTYYQAQNLNPDTVISAAGIPAALPSRAELNNLQGIVQNDLRPALQAADVDVTTFDLLKTPFLANNANFDKVLDGTTIGTNGLDFTATISGVTVAVTINLDADANGVKGDAKVTATTTDGAGHSSSASADVQIAPASQQSDHASAVAGVEDLLRRFTARLTAKRGTATAADFTEFLDDESQDDGRNKAQEAASFADSANTSFTGTTISFVELVDIEKFVADTSSARRDQLFTRAKVRFVPASGSPFTQVFGNREGFDSLVFRRQADGSWRFYGNRDVYSMRVRSRFIMAGGGTIGSPNGSNLDINSNRVPRNAVNSVNVTGPANSLPTVEPTCTNPPAKPLNQSSVNLIKTPRNQDGVDVDIFSLTACGGGGERVTSNPPSGTEYTFTFATGSGNVVQKAKIHASSNDTFTVTSLTDSAGTSFLGNPKCSAVAGKTLTAVWTRPSTFSVKDVNIYAFAANGSSLQGSDGPQLDPAALTGSITVPAMVNGMAPTNCGVTVSYSNLDGAQTEVQFNWGP